MEPQFPMSPTPAGSSFPPSNRSIGTGEGESPLAAVPQQNVSVRTMESDASSMKASGGVAPAPYTPKPFASSQPFTPPAMDNQSPVPAPMAPASPAAAPEKGSSGKGVVVAIVSFLVVLALAAAGYFFVYPLFVSSPDASDATVTESENIPEIPVEPVLTPEEMLTSGTPVMETTSTAPVVSAFLASHTSLFRTPADTTSEIALNPVTASAYRSSVPTSPVEVPMLREIVFRSPDGIIPSQIFLGAIFPATFTSNTAALFNPDFSFFTYTNASGTWPGFAVKLASGASIDAAKAAIKAMESGSDASALFLADPGTATASWKDGKFGTFSGRYLSFPLAGASLNYGWNGDTLIVSTNYTGAQEAARRTGL